MEIAADHMRLLAAQHVDLQTWWRHLAFGEMLDGVDRVIELYLERDLATNAMVIATVRVPPEGEAQVTLHSEALEELSRLEPPATG